MGGMERWVYGGEKTVIKIEIVPLRENNRHTVKKCGGFYLFSRTSLFQLGKAEKKSLAGT
jgi:hypothetical protein